MVIEFIMCLERVGMSYVTGFVKRDVFDKFSKIGLSSHSSATRIALCSDLIRAYHTVQLS